MFLGWLIDKFLKHKYMITITQTMLNNYPFLSSEGFLVNEQYYTSDILQYLLQYVKWQQDNNCSKTGPGRPTKPPHA